MALVIPSPQRKLYSRAAALLWLATCALATLQFAGDFSLLSPPSWVMPGMVGATAALMIVWPLSGVTWLEFWRNFAFTTFCLISLLLGWKELPTLPQVLLDAVFFALFFVALYLSARVSSQKRAQAAKQQE